MYVVHYHYNAMIIKRASNLAHCGNNFFHFFPICFLKKKSSDVHQAVRWICHETNHVRDKVKRRQRWLCKDFLTLFFCTQIVNCPIACLSEKNQFHWHKMFFMSLQIITVHNTCARSWIYIDNNVKRNTTETSWPHLNYSWCFYPIISSVTQFVGV